MAGQTLSQSETRVEALKLQSSALGVTLGLAWGVTRVQGNLLWYGGFRAIPHTNTTGGKGGGVKVQNTTFSYSASIAMGITETQVFEIPRIWRGKKMYAGGWLPTQLARYVDGFTVPASGPMTLTLTHADRFVSLVGFHSSGGTLPDGTMIYGYALNFVAGVHYAIDEDAGVVTILDPAYRGYPIAVRYQWATGTRPATAMEKLGVTLFTGALGQATWSVLTTSHPAEAIPYSGIAYVAGGDYDLGTGAQVENHNFEIVAPFAYTVGAGVPDANPADFLPDALCSRRYGASFPNERLDLDDWSIYCRAAGLLMSPSLSEQMKASDFVRKACELTNSIPVWSDGRLRIVPRGDKVLTGNGVTFTPNLTPVYDLDEKDLLPMDDGEAIHPTNGSASDAFNLVRVQFRNRDKQYNTDIAEAKDRAKITAYGMRPAPTVQANWICDAEVARKVAQLLLQYYACVRNGYEFRLPWTKPLAEPGDLLRIRETNHFAGARIVRVVDVDEDEDGEIHITAEDCLIGVATAAAYPSQASLGYAGDYNVSPGGVAQPVFFEAPVEHTLTGLQVYAAVKGQNANWGGCRAWVSLDGTNYRQIATIHGPSRYGELTGPIASGSLPVTSSGQLLNGSAADAAALSTLCYIGGATPEYLAYQTATLTGPGAYSLTGLVRGAYGSSLASAHATNDPFVRVDESVAKSGDLDLSYIGRTIYFKFTSFNVYGGAEEAIADVPVYTYPITGTMVSLPPSLPTSGTYALEPFGLRVSIAANPEPDVVAYEWRLGTVWAIGAVLEENGGTSYLLAVQTLGTFNVMVAARDALGIYSPPLLITASIAGPVVLDLVSSVSGTNLTLEWEATASAFAIAGYEVRHGASWAAGTFAQFVQSDRYTEIVKWGGARTYWMAAIDVRGNYGTPVSLAVYINAPSAVQSQRAEVVDNNALLYWLPPVTGDLPVERYEVRKGTTWAGGTVVGSNGNSTFAAIFEQQAGNYTYWITAYDSGGNEGTPAAITATINQPPDYILRSDINSALSGTLVNMYVEDGKVKGPVDTTQTWATHFSSRGWSTPDDQIAAGFPLYIEPSTTSGGYEEEIDYGVVLPATVVTATLSATTVHGTVAASCTLSYKVAAGDPWTVATAGLATIFAAGGFRYLRVHYDFTCTAGANLIEVSGINVKVSNKLKTDSGTFTITVAASGATVPFNVAFLDADTPICQANGSTPLIPVVDFSDVPNPTGFNVKLYNLSGVAVTGSGSWNAQGS